MASDDTALSAQQETAAAALAGGARQHEAAEAAGVSRRTVARWWGEVAGFRRLVADLRAEALEAAAGALADRAGDVAARILAIALEPSSVAPRDRLMACTRALTFAGQLHTIADIDRRITALEQRGDQEWRPASSD